MTVSAEVRVLQEDNDWVIHEGEKKYIRTKENISFYASDLRLRRTSHVNTNMHLLSKEFAYSDDVETIIVTCRFKGVLRCLGSESEELDDISLEIRPLYGEEEVCIANPCFEENVLYLSVFLMRPRFQALKEQLLRDEIHDLELKVFAENSVFLGRDKHRPLCVVAHDCSFYKEMPSEEEAQQIFNKSIREFSISTTFRSKSLELPQTSNSSETT
jgi:hypothetical protein